MTLFELIARVELQGKIRLSLWTWDGDEIKVIYLEDGMRGTDDVKALFDYEITYMFASGDGYLHIELIKAETA